MHILKSVNIVLGLEAKTDISNLQLDSWRYSAVLTVTDTVEGVQQVSVRGKEPDCVRACHHNT